MRTLFAWFLLLAWTFGCGRAPEIMEPKSTGGSGTQQSEETDLASLRYDTGDVDNWPDYHFPLHHTFDVPEVPPEIVGPFSLDDLPAPPPQE